MITPYFNDNDNFVLYNGDANTVLLELKEKGIAVSNNVFTVDDAVNQILNIVKGGTLND